MTVKEYFQNSKALPCLLGINVIIYIILALSALSAPTASASDWLTLPASWQLFLSRPWTLLTYMFTQLSFLHLLFNMLWLLWFGRIFLFSASGRRLVGTYIGGGLLGAILFLAVSSGMEKTAGSFLIGSSAAVLSVMTASTLMAPNLELRLLLLGSIRLKYVALLCIALTFLGIGGGNAGGLWAHIGGVLFGVILPSLPHSSKLSTLAISWRERQKKRRRKRHKPTAFADSSAKEALTGRLSDEARLDQLLDKVRLSGYNSLSTSEKKELNAISKKL